MSVRRKTENRLTLYRTCGICGKSFVTTADTPWVRMVPRDGKRQVITYYCSSSCFHASYKHKFDGKAPERKKERDKNRDVSEKNRRYYQAHAEELRRKAKEKYWADPEKARSDNVYQREKRKLIAGGIA